MKYEIVLCDDVNYAKRAKQVISEIIEENGLTARIITYTNPKKMEEDLESKKITPLLVFMDVLFEDVSGIDIAKEINKKCSGVRIVYLTDHLEYTTDVYMTDHFYYLKKGQLKERFPNVLTKLRKELRHENTYFRARLKNKKVAIINVKDILFFERQGRYTNIYTIDGIYQTKDKLDDIENRLNLKTFIRCHNSYLVSLIKIEKYKRDKFVIAEHIIPISRSYQQEVRKKYIKYVETSMIGIF